MKISAEQLALLDSYSSNSYASELVRHCKSIFPLIYDSLHEKTLRTNRSTEPEIRGRVNRCSGAKRQYAVVR
jgi:hypothetical protein